MHVICKKSLSFFILLATFIFLSRVSAHAATIYVSTTGDDTNTGTSESDALASIQQGCKEGTGGDTILVLPGSYDLSLIGDMQRITSSCGGTAGAYTTIKSRDGLGSVVLDASNATLGTKDSVINVVTSYIIVEGFEVQNSSGRGIAVYDSSNVIIRNNKVHHTDYRGIGGSGQDITIESNEVYEACRMNSDHLLTGGWPAAITSIGRPGDILSENFIIRNNHVYNNHGEGIGIFDLDGGIIENNASHDNWSVNIYMSRAKNITVQRNHSYGSIDSFNRPLVGRARGIEWALEGTAPFTIPSNITIANNVIANTSVALRYWFDDSNSGLDNTYQDISIFHNTIYYTQPYLSGAPEEFYAIHIDDVPDGFTQPSGTNEIRNNIVYSGGSDSSRPLFMEGDADKWIFSHNNWVDGIPTGSHSNSLSVDPSFTSASATNPEGFSLLSSSELIGKAFQTTVTTDYLQNTRSDPYDIGAFENMQIPTATPTVTPTPTQIGIESPSIPKYPVYRFWSDEKQGHFFTISDKEKQYVLDTYDSSIWNLEGIGFYAFASNSSGTIPVYRFWSDEKQGHFYTASAEEKDYVIVNYDDSVWTYEGIAFYVYPLTKTGGVKTVYRFWSDKNQHHFYTASAEERDYVIDTYDDFIWRYEGTAWNVPIN